MGVREVGCLLEEYMGYMSFQCLQSSSVEKGLSPAGQSKEQERMEREEE